MLVHDSFHFLLSYTILLYLLKIKFVLKQYFNLPMRIVSFHIALIWILICKFSLDEGTIFKH